MDFSCFQLTCMGNHPVVEHAPLLRRVHISGEQGRTVLPHYASEMLAYGRGP